MDSIVTPEHLYAYFYGFDKCTTIKKFSVSFHCREVLALSLPFSFSLSLFSFTVIQSFALLFYTTLDKHLHFNAMTHPTISITFNFHIMRPFSFRVIYSHFARYRFPGNCCIIIIQPRIVMLLFHGNAIRRFETTSVTYIHDAHTHSLEIAIAAVQKQNEKNESDETRKCERNTQEKKKKKHENTQRRMRRHCVKC